jgi:DDE superfamily endonuclease/Transposase
MAPVRHVLQPITGNRQRRKDLTAAARGSILNSIASGKSYSQIQKDDGFAPSTISDTLRLSTERPNQQSKKRTGRYLSYTDLDVRHLYTYVRRHPLATYAEIRFGTGVTLSNGLILQILRSYNLGHWKQREKPLITKAQARARYLWAKKYRNYTVNQWRNVISLDQASIERGSGAKALFTWRFGTEAFRPDLIRPKGKGKDLTVMIQACVTGKGKGPLTIMLRDPQAKKKGYSANSWRWSMEEIRPELREGKIWILMDNAPIHTAKQTREWCKKEGIIWLKIPPNSPDLNWIEHAWPLLKKQLHKHSHDLVYNGKTEEDLAHFRNVVRTSWEQVSDKTLKALCKSMPRRVQAIIRAAGWHTRY